MRARKIPVEIECVQFMGDNFDELENFIGKAYLKCPGDDYCSINTLEGTMKVSLYDYVIKGVNGEFYPCKNGIFAKTYEILT